MLHLRRRPHRVESPPGPLQESPALLLETGEEQPDQAHHGDEGQDDGLQYPHPFTLRRGSDDEWKDRTPGAANGHGEPNGADVDLLGEELGRHHDGAREERAEKEAEEGDGNGRDKEFGDEPEDEVEGDADGEVEGDAYALAEPFGHEAEGGAADGHAGPEAGTRITGGVAGGFADAEHECDHPSSKTDCVVCQTPEGERKAGIKEKRESWGK